MDFSSREARQTRVPEGSQHLRPVDVRVGLLQHESVPHGGQGMGPGGRELEDHGSVLAAVRGTGGEDAVEDEADVQRLRPGVHRHNRSAAARQMAVDVGIERRLAKMNNEHL